MVGFLTKLSGQHVLVTGGSKGIGRGIVQAFLAEGANVSYCSRSVRGNEFATFPNVKYGARAIGTAVDITDLTAIKTWVQDAANEFGKINIVVANAPTMATRPTMQDWQTSFQGDILGLITLIDAATPHLAQQAGNASIVVISSLAGFEARHPAVGGPYSTLKRAQMTLAKDYGRKLAPQGIRINCVVPGFVQTPNITHADGTLEVSTFNREMELNAGALNEMLKLVPLGRTGKIEEIANAVLFLGSNLSSYTSGSTLVIDGALSIFF